MRILLLVFFLLSGGFVFAKSPIFWIEPEYLLWSIKENPIPAPLLTTASYSAAIPGALGQPGTHTRLGHRHIDMDWMNGFQVSAGGSINQTTSIEGSYFLLPTVSKTRSFRTSGEPGSPNFAVPVFDITGVFGLNGIPGESVFILPGPLEGLPGFFGRFHFRISSRFQGAETNALYAVIQKKRFSLECLGGFRWLQLEEKLHFKAHTGTVPNFAFDAGFYNFSDRFLTTNNFLAAQGGIRARYLARKWRLDGTLKGALGATLEKIKIKGSSQTSGGNLFFATQGTAHQRLPGGIFAEPSNRGTHKRSPFAGAFEVQGRGAYQIARHCDITLGYTFLWVSKLLRPGNQIDRKINSTRTALAEASRETMGTGPGPIPFGMPGPAPAAQGSKRPKEPFRSSSFWAQGLDVGIRLNF